MKIWRITRLPFLLFISLILAACVSRPTPTPRPTSPPPQSAEETTPGEGQPAGEEAPSPTGQMPADVPLPPGYYNLQVMRNGTQIIFQVDGDLNSIVSFFQDELPKYDWVEAGPPDSAVGSMAALYREKEDGDVLTINISHNPLGNFNTINVALQRVGGD